VDRWVRGAFYERFSGFGLFPFRRRVSALPPATNASRSAADLMKEAVCNLASHSRS
jgi:hypothetical protein